MNSHLRQEKGSVTIILPQWIKPTLADRPVLHSKFLEKLI
jgi:hypothetical protein